MARSSPGPLSQWLMIQEQNKEEVENQVRAASAQLTASEGQLQALHDFRSRNNFDTGSSINGLQLNNTQQFNQHLDQVIQLQTQQVAVHESEKKLKDQQLKDAWFEVRKTEMLVDRNARRAELIQGRRDQKQIDEMAGVMLRRQRMSER